jgi:peptidoglycan/LPS O-acetylase OafA/YrhL
MFEIISIAAQADSGNPIQDTVLYTGTMKLLSDATNTLYWLAPAIAILLTGIFALCMKGADEQNAPRWKKRIIMVWGCLILILCASTIIKVLQSYYTVAA